MRASIIVSVSLKPNETEGHAMPEGTANTKTGTGFARAIWVRAARFDQRLRPTTAGKSVGLQSRLQRRPSNRKKSVSAPVQPPCSAKSLLAKHDEQGFSKSGASGPQQRHRVQHGWQCAQRVVA
jgi:hypothetical protein